MTYQGVIFDLDGTLLDTEAMARRAGEHAFQTLGLDVPDGFFDSLVGVDFGTGMAQIIARWPDLDTDRLNQLWGQKSRELHRHGIQQKPGVAQILDHIDQLNLPKAIATSSFRDSAQHKLQAAGLADRFDIVISVDCVSRAKPAPDPYLLAAERLGIAPTACLAFEDSETGAQSAFAAGMCVVLIPDTAPVSGQYAHHMAADLLAGAGKAGLI